MMNRVIQITFLPMLNPGLRVESQILYDKRLEFLAFYFNLRPYTWVYMSFSPYVCIQGASVKLGVEVMQKIRFNNGKVGRCKLTQR